MPFSVYIIRSLKDGSYYVGSIQDLDERIQCHSEGRSKYTKGKRPWVLVYSESFPDRSSAVMRENEIKKRKDREYIETLIPGDSVAGNRGAAFVQCLAPALRAGTRHWTRLRSSPARPASGTAIRRARG